MAHRNTQASVKLFGIVDLSTYSDQSVFGICVAGVFVCYFVYGVAQENVFNIWRREGTPCGWALTFLQYLFYTLFTYAQRIALNASARSHSLPSSAATSLDRVAPLSAYVMLAACSVGTVGLSNASCDFLTYPTQVLFKSSKILPVMLMGTIILRKSYQTIEYVCVTMITFGLIMLNISRSNRGSSGVNSDTTFGFVLISIALFADALIGNVQEKVFRQYNPTASESIFYTKFFGTFLSGLVALLNGQLNCLPVIFYSPGMFFYILIFCLSGVIGENFIMVMVKMFGALTTVTTTSVRKAVTIIFSFIIFPKPINSVYICGVLFVIFGIGMNIAIKSSSRQQLCGFSVGATKSAKKRSSENYRGVDGNAVDERNRVEMV